jgi:hypothetical protein
MLLYCALKKVHYVLHAKGGIDACVSLQERHSLRVKLSSCDSRCTTDNGCKSQVLKSPRMLERRQQTASETGARFRQMNQVTMGSKGQ